MPSKTTVLSELCHLDYDAVAAYEATLERIEDDTLKRTIAEFCKDHRDHITKLNELLLQNGEKEVNGTDLKKFLTKGKVVIAGLINDKAILEAMNMNEKVTEEAYEKALKNDELTVSERSVLEKHYADERRHKQWFSEMADKK
ncbi:PA2169 family four-helix-bundle protein [Alteromonas ponticola]|uniref:PA2169 family four-helix-bundle protein n=1 Tax=Alteromonas aquimaris TaxID=2998417 RepID=A0ABT3P9X1_9ALTE|nr:DUF2383 domain-containing protein [Alteromonas aquimaris]MCW8109581.1 PA2169 family four-helix-bundle protein [Alteromonas aquimaris]